MRDPARIEPTLERLAAAWRRVPDLRLGQLIGNVDSSYFLEDGPLLQEIEAYVSEMEA